MSDKPKQANRIPFEEIDEDAMVSSWALPSVGQKKSRIVFSAKKDKKNAGKTARDGEIVENYTAPVKPKPLTAEELQKMAEEAQKEGFDQGYQEGLQKGLHDGEAKGKKQGQSKAYTDTKNVMLDEIKRLNRISSDLLGPMQHQEEYLENIVLDMAVNFAKEILQKEIQTSPLSLLDVVHRALEALPAGASNITVYVNENDATLIDKHLPQAQRNWTVSIDDNMSSGGCRVETLESLVDYTVQHRLGAFLEKMREQEDITEDQVAPVEAFERSPVEPVLESSALSKKPSESSPESAHNKKTEKLFSRPASESVEDNEDLSDYFSDDEDSQQANDDA